MGHCIVDLFMVIPTECIGIHSGLVYRVTKKARAGGMHLLEMALTMIVIGQEMIGKRYVCRGTIGTRDNVLDNMYV